MKKTSFALLLIIQSLWANTFYVRPDGSNANTGLANRADAAWLTVQKAADAAVAGDTVLVESGNYPEKVTQSKNGNPTARITFLGVGAASVTIGGFYITGSDVSVIGFTLSGIGVDLYDAAITFYLNAHRGEVRDCVTQGVTGITQSAGGLYFYGNNCIADGLVVNEANFHALVLIGNQDTIRNFKVAMTTGWDVVRIVGSNDVIQDGVIHASNPGGANENHCDIFQTFGNDSTTVSRNVLIERVQVLGGQGYQFGNITDDQENGNISSWVFRNNLFVDIERVLNLFAPHCSFLNNTFVRCGAGSGWVISIGSSSAGHSDSLTLLNNIFYLCGDTLRANTGWYAGDAVTGTIADYNSVLGSGSGLVKESSAWRNGLGGLSGTFETHGFNGVTPLFVNSETGDFRLKAGSPFIGSAINLSSLYSLDISSLPRGADWDIGAFEFASNQTSTFPIKSKQHLLQTIKSKLPKIRFLANGKKRTSIPQILLQPSH
jgi:hypothetical protein